MPCRYDPSPAEIRAEQQAIGDRFDKLTRMLCEAMGVIDGHGVGSDVELSEELTEWWKEHKTFDEIRWAAGED